LAVAQKHKFFALGLWNHELGKAAIQADQEPWKKKNCWFIYVLHANEMDSKFAAKSTLIYRAARFARHAHTPLLKWRCQRTLKFDRKH